MDATIPQIRIVLNMIVKNEAANIGRSLRSVLKRGIVDAVCIADTGSTDNTAELIEAVCSTEKTPCRVFFHEWKNFGHNRTRALSEARAFARENAWPLHTTYALFLDADAEFRASSSSFSFQSVPSPPSSLSSSFQSVSFSSATELSPSAPSASALYKSEQLCRKEMEGALAVCYPQGARVLVGSANVEHLCDAYVYARTFMVRLDQPWTCKGAVHEAWVCDATLDQALVPISVSVPVAPAVTLKCGHVFEHNTGGNRGDKVNREGKLFEQDIADGNACPRLYYYYARNLRMQRRFEEANAAVMKCITTTHWPEERAQAACELIHACQDRGVVYSRSDEAHVWAAWAEAPFRGDVLGILSMAARKASQWDKAWLIASTALQYSEPPRQHTREWMMLVASMGFELGIAARGKGVLFVSEHSIHDDLFMDLCVAGYYLCAKAEAQGQLMEAERFFSVGFAASRWLQALGCPACSEAGTSNMGWYAALSWAKRRSQIKSSQSS
jgi:glycosyltransferase involved in cell wall biosynthesis